MFLLKLFHQSEPTRLIDSRKLEQGDLVIGRDPAGGWKIDDPDRQISRTHCTLRVRGGALFIRDTSSNGILLGRTQARLAPDQFVPLELGESLLIGKFTLTIEQASDDGFSALADQQPTRLQEEEDASPFEPPSGFADQPGLSTPRQPDPFASKLKHSALDDGGYHHEPFTGRSGFEGRASPQVDEDAWDRRDPGKVGDWNGPTAHSVLSHETLIGSPSEWAEPERTGPPEIGFGFDAPFHRPILRADPIPAAALLIPSDWDADLGDPPPSQAEPDPPARNEEFPAVARVKLAPIDAPASIAPSPMVAEAPQPAPFIPTSAPRIEAAPVVVKDLALPSIATPNSADGKLLFRAFCEGANLNPAEFADEDEAEVLRRAGAVYQQMVLGLGDLLGERTSLKNEYRMSRTSVAPEGNNPFKWGPARRVGVDLLRSSNEGFMSGPPAVRESFEDLKKHLLCLLAGMRASIASTLKGLSPKTVEAHLKKPAFIKTNRSAAAWTEYVRLHAEFQRQADDNPDSQINRDFRAAYEQQLGELDGHGARK